MKFGKTYMETMADPAFPEEWRNGALEYKHLKKLINGVVAELESIGLGADVLRELLVRPEDEAAPFDSPTSKAKPLPGHADDNDSALADDSSNSSEQEDGDGTSKKLTPAGKWVSDFSVDMIRRASSPGNRAGVMHGSSTDASESAQASTSTSQAQEAQIATKVGLPGRCWFTKATKPQSRRRRAWFFRRKDSSAITGARSVIVQRRLPFEFQRLGRAREEGSRGHGIEQEAL